MTKDGASELARRMTDDAHNLALAAELTPANQVYEKQLPVDEPSSFVLRPSSSIRIFASPLLPPSPQELAGLDRIARLDGVAQVVALPDLHLKPLLETPSSTATATRETVILNLSSPSPGCGMALALTPLGLDDLSELRLDALFRDLAHQLPIKREAAPARVDDIRPVLLHGPASLVDRLGLDPHLLSAIEQQGNFLAAFAAQADPEQILETIPTKFLPLAARELGIIGRGNHFLELQVVEDLLDEGIAAEWGVQAGQVVVMVHADSGRLGAFIGRLYAHRLKNNWRGRLLELRYKTAFHLARARSAQDAYRRLNYYFTPRRHTSLPATSPYAQRALLALWAATNYAFANRVAVLAALRDALQGVWGRALGEPALLYDVTHNSIRPVETSGESFWLHRHNASQALPPMHPGLVGTPFYDRGQPVLLPGTNRTHSYLCVAGVGTAHSLYSVDHGAGRSALRLGRETSKPGQETRLYDTQGSFLASQPHLGDEGLDEVLSILDETRLAHPVARLRPLAVLKDIPA